MTEAERKLYEPIELLCNLIGWHKVTVNGCMLQERAFWTVNDRS